MLPLVILFADITAVVCAAGAIIFMILVFGNWDKHLNEHHEEHASDSHGH